MAVIAERRVHETIHPLHAVLLAGSVSLFVGAALSDMAYASTYEIQWNNFASWLIAGGLVIAGIALLSAIVALVRGGSRRRGMAFYAMALLVTWIVGFLNALMHARDAWAGMPAGLVLSIVVAVLALLAMGLALRASRTGGAT